MKTQVSVNQIENVFTAEEKNTLLNGLNAISTASQQVEDILTGKAALVEYIANSEEKLAEITANVWAEISNEPTTRQACKVYEINDEVLQLAERFGLDVNEKLNLVYLGSDRAVNTTMRNLLESAKNLSDKKYIHKNAAFQALRKFIEGIRQSEKGKEGKEKQGSGKKFSQIVAELGYIEKNWVNYGKEEKESILLSLQRLAKELKIE